MSNKKQKRTDNSEPNKVYFWSLLTLIALCVISYGFLFRGTLVNIVARQNMEGELQGLSSKVASLESEYIKTKNNITPELALNLGFIAVSNQKFVTKDTKTSGLSLVTPTN
jgi:hypothetical protein